MHKLITYILTFLPICVFAQVESDIYEYKNVDFDSVIVAIDYPDWNDSPKVRNVYIFSNGNNTLYKSYQNDTLYYISENDYNNEKLIKIKNFTEIFSYVPDLKKHVGAIRDDYFNGREFIYHNDKLIKIQYYMSIEGYISYDYDIIFEYDNQNQLIKEINMDKHIEFIGEFRSNSTDLDTIYYKNSLSFSYKTYNYYSDSILVKYYSDSLFTGYEWYFGDLEFPDKIKKYSNSDKLIGHIIYIKNDQNLVTDKIYRLKTSISPWGGTLDVLAEDKISIDYNDKDYPATVRHYENDKLIMMEKLKYY